MTAQNRQPSALPLLQLNRRSFLKYVGTGAAFVLGSGSLGSLVGCTTTDPEAWTTPDGSPRWIAPDYPVPLPGDGLSKTDFASYEVVDDLVLPDGFKYEVVAQWGDRFGAEGHQITFGYNNDYTGLLPIPGSEDEFWLFVNHEYLSLRPWMAAQTEAGLDLPKLELKFDPERPWFSRGIFSIEGWQMMGHRVDLDPETSDQEIPEEVRGAITRLCDEGLAVQGISVLRVKQNPGGTFSVVADAKDHRRIATQTTENIGLDENGLPGFRFTGPAALLMDEPPRGTFCNCSGGTTPWGTFLTCEENFHFQTGEEITPAGQPLPAYRRIFQGDPVRINGQVIDDIPEPKSVTGLGNGSSRLLDGRHYGWVAEIDPATGALEKHTSLGRFHHENVTLRVQPGQRIAAYMGDDRRGGHVWKFVSDEAVGGSEKDPSNSALLHKGTLYVARFNEDFTGEWIAIEPETPLRRPEPEHCQTEHVIVPARFVGGYVAIGNTDRDNPALEVEDWQEIISEFSQKPFEDCTLGDLVRFDGEEATREKARGVLLMDAFAMANAAGGTPTARPEDLEVHPLDQSVYIAFTDASEGSDGSPDMRIFPDSKRENSRQYGAIYRVVENDNDPAATSFTWGKFLSSGEIAENGGGFANADNLVFDPQGNLWMVTDITMSSLNFPTNRKISDGTQAGGKQFPGVFGNNAMFMIPTQGPQAGVPHLFAIGPMECEICGPTFTEDGKTLILSIQHPGEETGTRQADHPSEIQTHIVHDRDNQPFEQERTVPVGSNFPSGQFGKAPRPCVVCITRVEAEIT